jgi:ribonuclease-3
VDTEKNDAEEGDELIRLADTISLEYAVSALQQSIRTILASDLDEARLKVIKDQIDKITSPQVLLALNRSKLPLAAKLKSSYDAKKLDLFDQILNFEENSNITETRFGNPVLGSLSTELKVAGQTFDPATYEVPALPEIKNPAIRAQVFVHKSCTNIRKYFNEKEQMRAHNERLEFLGDSVLNNIMTFILVNHHPYADEGELSQLRTRLINNATLTKWSMQYGLDKRLQYQTDDSILHGRKKIFADVFEAYVGGLTVDNSNNYSVIYEWLRQLALPILANNDDGVTKRVNSNEKAELNLNSKVELYSLIGFARLGLKYECVEKSFEKDYTDFKVQVKVANGEVLGTGSGKNVKEAGMRAAMAVLANKEIIERYSRLRASIPREDSAKPLDNRSLEDKEEYLKSKQELKTRKSSFSTSSTPIPPPPPPPPPVPAPAPAPASLQSASTSDSRNPKGIPTKPSGMHTQRYNNRGPAIAYKDSRHPASASYNENRNSSHQNQNQNQSQNQNNRNNKGSRGNHSNNGRRYNDRF